MLSSHRRIIPPQRASKRNRAVRVSVISIAACSLILVTYVLIWSSTHPATEKLIHQIQQVEAAIGENESVLARLAFHERRLSSDAIDSRSYRLPVLVQGRSVYISVDASEMEELANALALEDLMGNHLRNMKGHFYSGDAAAWQPVLVAISMEAKSHLTEADLPNLRKRMEEIRRTTTELEARRTSLQAKLAKATP